MFEVKYICGHCIDEEFLQKYINSNGQKGKCTYCGKKSMVLLFDEILEIIDGGVNYLYDDPANGLGWDDGEYIKGKGPIYYAEEMLAEIGLGDSKEYVILSTLNI